MIKKSIYGGNCQVFRPHMTIRENEIGFELDMTNMYGKAMRMAIPYAVAELWTPWRGRTSLCCSDEAVARER